MGPCLAIAIFLAYGHILCILYMCFILFEAVLYYEALH